MAVPIATTGGFSPGTPVKLFEGPYFESLPARVFDVSPDGRWLLITWPTANQWIFVRADGKRIRAISNASSQFESGTFPKVEGWAR